MGSPSDNSNSKGIAFVIVLSIFSFILIINLCCQCNYRESIDEELTSAFQNSQRLEKIWSHDNEDTLSSEGAIGGFPCQTPNGWLSQASPGLGSDYRQKWPNGIVPYKLHSSLTYNDVHQVQKAFAEYHSKTCIKFKPRQEGDESFISIKIDNRVCGQADVCKIGGRQLVKFGRNCRNAATMIHQLGHVLCLRHEHQRSDRDNYLNLQNCDIDENGPMVKLEAKVPNRLYDYGSQMHFHCGQCPLGLPKNPNVTKCGGQITHGLSVLDADHINSLYDCQGCFRHRWRPVESLVDEDFNEMYNFGYTSRLRSPLYPCRAQVRGEIAIGKFQKADKICYIPSFGKEIKLRTNFEVLTIPGGLRQSRSIYKLAKKHESGISPFLVPGGRQAHQAGLWTLYIAFANLRNKYNELEGTIGKYSLEDDSALFPLGGDEQGSRDFSLLICQQK